jgi:ABC-type nitrate/sulfonate/bicarbonate transport system ATPase subunit
VTAVAVDGLSHRFGDLSVLDDISFSVAAGGFVSLLGPSGCGKSTVLRVLAGLLVPDTGTATVGGEAVVGRPGLTAYMPQRDLLLPWRRALPNATVGAEARGLDRAAARGRAAELFDRFGLAGFERSWPHQLSGGMRQRLALLRTFVAGLDVLLLDEPFGALDALTRRDLQTWLEGVLATDRHTVLLVTHDVDEALFLADHILVFSPRPATVLKEFSLGHQERTHDLSGFAAMRSEILRLLGINAEHADNVLQFEGARA